MTFLSHARNFEDALLWRALGHAEHGFYLDVGAFLPDVESVTRAFSERGWRGINIAAHPAAVAHLAAARPRDVTLGDATALAAIGSAQDQDASGTGMAAHGTLGGIWDAHVPPGQPVHFLHLDVEGREAAILGGLHWSRQRPWIVVVAVRPESPAAARQDWQAVLEGAGYGLVRAETLSLFFVADEHAVLARHFDGPPEPRGEVVRSGETVRSALLQAFEAADDARRRAGAAERSLARLALERQALEAQRGEAARARSSLAEEAAWLAAELRRLQGEAQAAAQQRDYLLERSPWEAFLFRRSGKPKRLFRNLLFHRSGKPRKLFRRWVLKDDGTPRAAFAMWMTNPAYLALRYPASLRPPEESGPGAPAPVISPRGALFLRRLRAARAHAPEV